MRDRHEIYFLFWVALTFRLIYLYQIKDHPFFENPILDPLYYHNWALEIAQGEWLGDNIFEMSPLYPYFLAGIYQLFGPNLYLVRCIQIIIGSLSCVAIFFLGKMAFNRGIGFLAGLMACLYGPFIFHEGLLMKTSLGIFLSLLTTLCLFKAYINLQNRDVPPIGDNCITSSDEPPHLDPLPPGKRVRVMGFGRPHIYLLGGGLFLGLAALVRENFLLVAPLILICLFYQISIAGKPRVWLEGMSLSGFFLLGVALVLIPLTVRNYIVGKEFVLITTGMGQAFYAGNNPQAHGRYTPPDFIRQDPQYEHDDFRNAARRISGKELTRGQCSSFWFKEGLRFIREQPMLYMRLLVKKLLLLLGAYEVPDNHNYYFFKSFSSLLRGPVLHFGIVAPLGLMGLIIALPYWRRLLILYSIFIGYMGSVLIFFIFDRFRLFLVPILMIFAAFFLDWLWKKVRTKDYKKLILGLVPALILSIILNFPSPDFYPEQEFQREYYNLGTIYGMKGQWKEGIAVLKEAIRINPKDIDAHYNLGLIYKKRGWVKDALKEFHQVLRLRLNDTQAYQQIKMLEKDYKRD